VYSIPYLGFVLISIKNNIITFTIVLTATIFPIIREIQERNLSGINNAAVLFDCSGGYINWLRN